MYHRLALLYIFGYKLQDTDLCDAVLETIIKAIDEPRHIIVRCLPSLVIATLEYEEIAGDRALRRLLVNRVVEFGREVALKELVKYGPSELVVDLLKKYAQVEQQGGTRSVWERREEWLKEA
ncbi:hypothetical protein DOTSEDRAFT_26413 [Dothistroma septosporum NZE10]|uniref:Uncharacterized protein n=1 Tax=Dothistroma septosporum (strain NZE10 / CBS 128990) TaxID=675120 RepID=N1PIU2_DOTSN|nr:hypothetical protein DOTSEDRAFT_26413 [Dothistroma septosporum NZE10]